MFRCHDVSWKERLARLWARSDAARSEAVAASIRRSGVLRWLGARVHANGGRSRGTPRILPQVLRENCKRNHPGSATVRCNSPQVDSVFTKARSRPARCARRLRCAAGRRVSVATSTTKAVHCIN